MGMSKVRLSLKKLHLVALACEYALVSRYEIIVRLLIIRHGPFCV